LEHPWTGRARSLEEVAKRSGEKHPGAQITAADARAIYSRYLSGETGVSIAADYNIHPGTVAKIGIRKAWIAATQHLAEQRLQDRVGQPFVELIDQGVVGVEQDLFDGIGA
jgi:hypothetical protein